MRLTHRGRARFVSSLVALALVAGACAGGTQGSSGTAGQPTLQKLKLGLGGGAPPGPDAHSFFYAKEKGFWAEEGVEVDIQAFNGDQTALRALAVKDVDITFAGCGTALQALEVGSPIRIISAFAPNVDYQFIAQKPAAGLKDMVGKNLGVSQPGAVSHLVPQLMLEAAGIKADAVKIVSIGGSGARVQALVAKTIDGAVLNAAFVPRALKYDYLSVIADAPLALPDYLFTCEVVRTDTIEQKAAALQGFVNGLMKGNRWFYKNLPEAKVISKKIVPETAQDDVNYAIDTYAKTKYHSVTGALSAKQFDFTVKAQVDAKILISPLKLEQAYQPKFVEAGLKKLGPG